MSTNASFNNLSLLCLNIKINTGNVCSWSLELKRVLEDYPRSENAATVNAVDNIDRVHQIVTDDRHLTLNEIGSAIILSCLSWEYSAWCTWYDGCLFSVCDPSSDTWWITQHTAKITEKCDAESDSAGKLLMELYN